MAKVSLKEGVISGFENRVYTTHIGIPPKGSTESITNFASITLMSGQKKTLISLVEVHEPGLYLVEFESVAGKGVRDIRKKVQEIENRPVINVKEFIIVGESPNKSFERDRERPRFI